MIALLIVADALLLVIALVLAYDFVDRRWARIQGAWFKVRRKVFGRWLNGI